MTCHELHRRFEDCSGKQREHLLDSPEVAAHVRECPACRNFANSRGELFAQLQGLREAVPKPSSALDASMLSHYRQYILQPSLATSTHAGGWSSLRWGVAIAALVLITTGLFFLKSKRQYQAYSPPAPAPLAPQFVAITHAAIPPEKRLVKSHHDAPKHAPRRLPEPEVAALPGFESLMYCDPLSCSGDMEMIRVQLPASALAIAPVSTQANHPVYADVLVGPDGIARGIRIVQ